ncbi:MULTISPECIES: hypothetical protein [unclassified Sporosarcina]|uniref:hypothetical protein n=1 Tax=unclassified Sporosarcina TaxID=2647733 RepID=UPI001A930118|nr:MULTISPECIES: hypothetical protein [unclassified Sporosarcina]MBO0588358.1 hypothetical protein [Sporosarcina sp. E16_8]MBO0603629.1 hypothetical protein [Sporosarcina sp. E16_3]
MKLKPIYLICLALLITGCGVNNEKVASTSEVTNKNNAAIEVSKVSNDYNYLLFHNVSTIDDLAEVSPIVITAKGSGVSEEFMYKDLSFYKTRVKMNDIFRDEFNNLDKDLEITILQNDGDMDPKIQNNETVLLFLEKYEGPIIEDAYVIIGMKQGQFKYNNDGTIMSKANDFELSRNTKNDNLKSVESALEKVPYVNQKRKPRTKEEIEALNKAEEQLPESKDDINN